MWTGRESEYSIPYSSVKV